MDMPFDEPGEDEATDSVDNPGSATLIERPFWANLGYLPAADQDPAAGFSRAHGRGEYPLLPRAVLRTGAGDRRFSAAERLPSPGPGRYRQPRPADLAGLGGRPR